MAAATPAKPPPMMRNRRGNGGPETETSGEDTVSMVENRSILIVLFSVKLPRPAQSLKGLVGRFEGWSAWEIDSHRSLQTPHSGKFV